MVLTENKTNLEQFWHVYVRACVRACIRACVRVCVMRIIKNIMCIRLFLICEMSEFILNYLIGSSLDLGKATFGLVTNKQKTVLPRDISIYLESSPIHFTTRKI